MWRKIQRRIAVAVDHRRRRSFDLRHDTHSRDFPALLADPLLRLPDAIPLEAETARTLAGYYLEHRFEWLGLGWRSWNAQTASSPVPVPHQAEQQALAAMLPATYQRLDWHLDPRSGYRWPVDAWCLDLHGQAPPGADIKYPWELGRLGHLPRLATAACLLPDLRAALIEEFRHVTLDFIAHNPPRIGVQWASGMDVGLRAVNLLVSFDLFRQLDDEGALQGEWLRLFNRSIADHGRYLVTFLEGSRAFTNNHYLGCLVGMIAAGAWLEPTDETDRWLALGAQDLVFEIEKQFHPDGSNFEASSCYHAFSTEMVAWAVGLLLALPDERRQRLGQRLPAAYPSRYAPNSHKRADAWPFPAGELLPAHLAERLACAGECCRALIRPDGCMVQVGDNDSGHLLHVAPTGRWLDDPERHYQHLQQVDGIPAPYWDENVLDYSRVPALVDVLFGASDPKAFLFEALIGKHRLPGGGTRSPVLPEPRINSLDAIELPCENQLQLAPEQPGPPLTEGLSFTSWPDAGWHIFRSPRLHLVVSAGGIGQHGIGGHAHNDQLSFELSFDGIPIVVDPGTGVYTADLQQRNRFRSIEAHSAPIPDPPFEPNSFLGCFRLAPETTCRVVEASGNCLVLLLTHSRYIVRRTFSIGEGAITITDRCTKPFTVRLNYFRLYSPGYGRLTQG